MQVKLLKALPWPKWTYALCTIHGYKHHPNTIPCLCLCTTWPTITETLNFHIQEALEQVQWDLPCNFSACLQAQVTPRRKLLSAALGAPPPTRVEDPTQIGGSRLSHAQAVCHFLAGTMTMHSTCLMTSTSLSQPVTSPSLPPVLKSLTVASVASTPKSETHPRADLGVLPEDVLWLQGEMNAGHGVAAHN